MYAVFEIGGQQFRAELGDTLRVPLLEVEEGDTVSFEKVLLGADGEAVAVGDPLVSGAVVKAEVLRHGKDAKIIVFKRKRRKGYRKKQGHRQKFTEVRISDIDGLG